MTIRLKLAVGSILVILLANAVLSLVAVQYLERVWLDGVQTHVRLNLQSAQAGYRAQYRDITRFLQAAALDRSLVDAAKRPDKKELTSLVQDVFRTSGMDFVTVLDRRGKVLARGRNPRQTGDELAANPLVANSLKSGLPQSGTLVLSSEQLAREGNDLAKRAVIVLHPTPAAIPTDEKTRSEGMIVAAAVPFRDGEGNVAGLLYGGNLLNRRSELIDEIHNDVFSTTEELGPPLGTVTIFLGDLRIATNVLRPDGSRAVGTRMSQEVEEEVIERGGTWASRALVVDDWYITAYEPIRDPTGKILGALYVGLREAPFAQKHRLINLAVLTMVLAATLASLLLLGMLTMFVLRPIDHLVAMAQRMIDGDMSARVGIRPPAEMGVLCRAIDAMADAVAQREQELKRVTQQHIGRSEKLASIGRLAAGVAHEINNPLTGVLTFAHLLRDKPNMDEQDRQDLNLIIHETTRAAEIVRGLLDFARERAAIKEPLDINDVVRRTVRLIRNQKSFEQISIEERLCDGLPEVEGDMNQLQQVLLNLSLNACEAMPKGGTITVESTAADGHVVLTITDTGCGIKKDLFDKIFDPFFTTKPVGKGTGLGLSVTYGIVQSHGGTIEVASEEGKGTTFTISLPAMKKADQPL